MKNRDEDNREITILQDFLPYFGNKRHFNVFLLVLIYLMVDVDD